MYIFLKKQRGYIFVTKIRQYWTHINSIIHAVPLIVSPSTAVLSRRTPAVIRTSCDSCSAQGNSKRDTLYLSLCETSYEL